ncbi:unnamed protein product [Larinioides sclopetarius]|uniref:Uncharacterized protein n=1 Tax=Larinioides sclopetarius TaxID=280406 RepID=A0AAV2AYR5_9ARAC
MQFSKMFSLVLVCNLFFPIYIFLTTYQRMK